MLSSQAREILTGVEAVIVDEIHAVAPTKRGSHLALTLERLERHVAVNAGDGAGRERPIQRIGLSATQRPLERIASSSSAPSGSAGSSTPAAEGAGPGDRRPGRGHGRPDEHRRFLRFASGSDGSGRSGRGRRRAAGTRPAAPGAVPGDSPSRGIWPAIYPELLRWSASTPRRSSSSTTAAAPSGSQSA